MKKYFIPCATIALLFITPFTSREYASVSAQAIDLSAILPLKGINKGYENSERTDIITNPLEVWIEGETLVFFGQANFENMCVYITDQKNRSVLYDVINVYNNTESYVDVSDLTFGTYTLHVIVDEIEYSARFNY